MTEAPTIPLIRLFDCLIVSVQVDLDDAIIERLTVQVTDAIEQRAVTGLILDLSGADLIDSHISRRIRDLAVTARVMGVRTVMCGLRASVVITLVEMGLGIPGVRSALNLERALELLLVHDDPSPSNSREQAEGEGPLRAPSAVEGPGEKYDVARG